MIPEVTDEDILEGSIPRSLIFLSAPLLLQNLVQLVQLVVDLFWVARLGDDAIAALGFAAPVTGLLTMVVTGIPYVGTQLLVANRHGGGDEAETKVAFFTGILFAVALGLLLGALVYSYAGLFLQFVDVSGRGATSQVMSLAETYITILAAGIVFAGLGDTIEGGLVGRGDSKAAFYISVASVLPNVVLDPLLILGYGPFPRLGMAGAALATVAGYVGGLVLGLLLVVRRGRGDFFSWDAVTIDLHCVKKMARVASPQVAQRVSDQVLQILMVIVVFRIGGSVGIAVYTVGNRISSIVRVPAIGLQMSSQTIVAQNVGSGRVERAKDAVSSGVTIGVAVLAVFTVLQLQFGRQIGNVFISTADSLPLATQYLDALAFSYPFVAAGLMIQAGFNGTHRTEIPFVSRVLRGWGLRLPLTVVGGLFLDYGMSAVFWSFPIAAAVVTVGLGVFYALQRDSLFSDASSDERSEFCEECGELTPPDEYETGDSDAANEFYCAECVSAVPSGDR